MDRQKRHITKPARYLTTSSEEEAPKRKGKTATSCTPRTVEDGINDISKIIEKENYILSNSLQHPTSTQIFTNTNSGTYISHTQTQAQNNTSHTHRHTNLHYSPHTQSYSECTTHTQAYTHLENPPYPQPFTRV